MQYRGMTLSQAGGLDERLINLLKKMVIERNSVAKHWVVQQIHIEKWTVLHMERVWQKFQTVTGSAGTQKNTYRREAFHV